MKKVLYLSFVILLFCTSNSYSQKWKKLGSLSPYISSFAKDGNFMYAGSMNYGIYVSSNNGSTWQSSNNGLTEVYIDPIFIQNHKIYIGTNNGIFISSDFGQNWKKYDSTLNNQEISKIFTFKNTLYAYDVLYRYLYVSNDEGLHWDTLSNTGIDALCFQSQGDSLFLGGRKGIYLSLDSGRTWKILKSIEEDWVYNMFISDNIFYFVTGGSSVYLSKDYGVNWEIKYFPIKYANDIFLVKNDIYLCSYRLGLYYSNNDGDRWVSTNLALSSNKICVFFCTYIDSTFYSGTDEGGIKKLALDFLDVKEDISISNKQTNVYPNPAQDILTIKDLPADFNYNTSIEIYNIYSLKELSSPYKSEIDISKLSPGIYYIKINNEILKFVKF